MDKLVFHGDKMYFYLSRADIKVTIKHKEGFTNSLWILTKYKNVVSWNGGPMWISQHDYHKNSTGDKKSKIRKPPYIGKLKHQNLWERQRSQRGNTTFLRSKSAFYLIYPSQISLKKELDYPPQKSRIHWQYRVSQRLHCCHSLVCSSYGQPELVLRDNLTPWQV